MLKIYFGNVLINDDAYAEITNDYKLFNDSFYLGSTASNAFKLKILKSEVSNHPTNVKIEDDNTTFHLIVDKVEEEKGFYNYTLVDKMVNFNFNYDAKPLIDENLALEEETYLSDILEDMCLKANIELDYVLTNDIVVNWYDSRIQAREYLSFIAELEGGYACINELGKLTIKQHKQASKKTISVDEVSELIIGERKLITRVVYDNGVVKIEFGNDTGNTLYLNQNNVFITDEVVVENIYNKIVNFEFYTLTVPNSLIDSSIKAGDVITFADDNNEYPTIAQYSTSYGGGWVGSYDFNINTEKQEETQILGLYDSVLSIRTEIDRTNAELKITAEKITDLTDFIKNITNQGDHIKLPNTPKSNGAIRELKIKNFQLMELYPGMSYPSGFVYPGVLNFYMLIFDNIDTFDNNPHYIYIQSPIPLQSVIFEGQTYHNELVIEENKVKIIENIKWNFETEKYEVMPIPTIHELTTVVLPTFEVDTYIKVDYFTDLIFEAEYLIKNDFTDTFTTQAESSSQFTINSEEIATKVSKDNIISEINQSAEAIKISANKIILEGNEEFSSTISQLNNKINDIQNQVDGKVSTFYGADVPTLYNYPADGWITEEERNNHLGDLYYDAVGKAYRFSFIDNTFLWNEIADSDIQAIYDELSSTITQTEDRINLEVAKKTTKTEIISTINQSAEAIAIDANKISLVGKTIDLTSDNIVIDSTNFKVTKAGVVTATNVNLSGNITATSGSFTGSINATSGRIAKWLINDSAITNEFITGFADVGRTGIAPGVSDVDLSLTNSTVRDGLCFWAGATWHGGLNRVNYAGSPFRVYADGSLYATNAQITGSVSASNITGSTISGGTISGTTISGTNAYFGNYHSGGELSYYNGVGFMRCGGGISTHPWFSALNISRQNGIYFYSGTTRNGVGSLVGSIDYVNNYCRVSGSLDVGGNVFLSGSHITGPTGSTSRGSVYINERVVLVPSSSGYAYVDSSANGNRISVLSGSNPSSRNVKKNIKELKYENIYKDLQKLKTYTFDYKYGGIKDDKSDFGFIIDEVENLPELSKLAMHYDEIGYLIDGKLIPKKDGNEEQKDMKPFNYKKWDRDSYIKMSLVLIKSLQEKVDSLEEVIYGKAN